MNRNILSLCVGFAFVSTTILTTNVSAQSTTKGEELEQINFSWNTVTDNLLIKFHPSANEINTFYRFDQEKVTALKLDFFAKMRMSNSSNTGGLIKDAQTSLSSLYEKFIETKKAYPSSVSEYSGRRVSTVNPCDSSGCTNMDFRSGDFTSWYGYYANHDYNCSVSTLSSVTGGSLGAVTLACNDPATASYNRLINDYQLSITSSGYDAIIPAISRVSPWATGGHSVMLGDSTWVGYGSAILEKTFYVSPGTANLTYQYAVFLENPASHCKGTQPLFTVAALDENGDTIPNCGEYNVTAGYGTNTFDSTIYNGVKLFYRDWTIANVPLKNYIGHCVTIVFEVRDCGQGGHFGYAYVDASCSPLTPISSSPGFCGQDSIQLIAPPGAQTYEWIGPSIGSIRTDTSKQIVWVDSVGTYTVVTIPVTGVQCADTLTITLGKAAGPPPHPNFAADTVCAGSPTKFTNISLPSTGKFWWDFYNIGIYNLSDTNNFNPTWTYVTPGTYHVKLHEVFNGCGTDTVLTIKVDTVPSAGFTASGGCMNTPITFSNTSVGAGKYYWNFGDPSSAPKDTSTAISPTHTFTTAATYTVTLVVTNSGHCSDTVKQTITIYPIPHPVITGDTLICPGQRDTLSVTGGTTYLWSNGKTTSQIAPTPSSTITYTVTAYNGTCTHDTTFTIHMIPAPSPTITVTKDSVCKGDTITLEGSGATTYKWLPSNNTTTKIQLTVNKIDTIRLVGYGGVCVDTATVIIGVIKQITAASTTSVDSICPGQSAVLTTQVSGSSGTYSWNTGETTSSITVSPATTTTYTCTITGKCNTITNTVKVTVDPIPVVKIKGTPWKCQGIRDTLTVTGGVHYIWSNGKTTTTYITGPINGDSVISVVAYNNLGCSDTTKFLVTLRPKPNIIITAPTKACAGQSVLLTATGSGVGPFTYSWSVGGTTVTIISNYDTVTVNPDVTTIYTVKVSNGCLASKSTSVVPDNPPMLVCCDKAIVKGDDTILIASNSTGKIYKYNWYDTAGVVCLDPPKCDSVKVKPSITTTYTVIGTDSLGCQIERVVTIVVETPCFDFKVPNVFTPNYPGQSGLNAEFYIKTENIDGWAITIFDRWGKEMFKSSNPYVYWTGLTEGGAKAPDGVYYYIITGSCQNNTYKRDGFVQLIR